MDNSEKIGMDKEDKGYLHPRPELKQDEHFGVFPSSFFSNRSFYKLIS